MAGLEAISFALSQPVRWRMLAMMAEGAPLAAKDVAKRLGMKRPTASEHLILLRKAGLAVQGAARLYTSRPP